MAIKVKIKDGKKFYEVYVNGRAKSGERVQMRRRSLESLRKAEEAEFELKRELAKLKECGVEPRWGEWVSEAKKLMKLQYRPSTLYTYEKTLAKWIPEKWNDKDLSDFSRSSMHEFIYETMPPETSVSTRKFVLKIIKRIFQMAIDHGKLEKNPCHGLIIKVPERDKKVLTNTEAVTFLKAARELNHRFYPVWVAALFTGMRSGELYALKWTDVDFDASTISVSKAWNSKNGFTPTKSQKSRVVPISEEFMRFLKELRLKRGKTEFVLPHLEDWARGSQAKVTRAFCKAIGVTDVKFHDLRATFITNLLSRGVPLAQVMAIVGHADMDTTNVYLRKAGVEVQGSTESLGYKIPSDPMSQVLSFPRALDQT